MVQKKNIQERKRAAAAASASATTAANVRLPVHESIDSGDICPMVNNSRIACIHMCDGDHRSNVYLSARMRTNNELLIKSYDDDERTSERTNE